MAFRLAFDDQACRVEPEHRTARRSRLEVVSTGIGRQAEEAGDERPTLGHLMPEGAQDRPPFGGRQLAEHRALATAGSLERHPTGGSCVLDPLHPLAGDDVARSIERDERDWRASHPATRPTWYEQDVLRSDPEAKAEEQHVRSAGWNEPPGPVLVAHRSSPA